VWAAVLGSFVITLDAMVVNVALPSIRADLGGGIRGLQSVPAHRSGVVSRVFNTSRHVGSALAVAVFGALIADRAHVLPGLRESLVIAAVVTLTAAAANLRGGQAKHKLGANRTRSWRR
jgi:MFS family permease